MGELIEADYGEGAYGPTIMIIIRSVAGVDYLVSLLRDLSTSDPGTAVQFHELSQVTVGAAVFHLTLLVAERSGPPHLKRTRRGGFDWSCTPYEWETAALLVEGLYRGPGHQYLASEVGDDAVVQVSYGEMPYSR